MRPHYLLLVLLCLLAPQVESAEPDFPLTADSKPQPEAPKGEMIKGTHSAKEGSVFPGTQREYQLYIPHGLDRSKPAGFMVFQDGVIYQAPVVFDNLIAKKDIPPLIGVFIKPGVVPAANENALPRFNRSYEYDSITDNYSRFLIEEFLPAIEAKHGIKLSTDPNDAAISGNSSGGIAAFMVAWHRSDRFRRVFTGVGTYVGIHGGDRLPVLVRKVEPKPIRIFLQSGTGDNNLYCGDWWMANQMMERSFTWAGYDVNHAWGEGGHNQKHASQIFPDVMRWLWRDWQMNKEIKANAKGESKWKGYEVVDSDSWNEVVSLPAQDPAASMRTGFGRSSPYIASSKDGTLFIGTEGKKLFSLSQGGSLTEHFIGKNLFALHDVAIDSAGACLICFAGPADSWPNVGTMSVTGEIKVNKTRLHGESLCQASDGRLYVNSVMRQTYEDSPLGVELVTGASLDEHEFGSVGQPLSKGGPLPGELALSPDQRTLYMTNLIGSDVWTFDLGVDGIPQAGQSFTILEQHYAGIARSGGLCVDTEGRLYVATALGIQVCDQAGRVNFIIPTPQQPSDVCFGGKDLTELFIACGDKIYKRPTKVHGIVSGQMPPIKPAPPKL